MVSKIDQIAIKPADVKPKKASETASDDSSFSSVLSQEINQKEQKVSQIEEQGKNCDTAGEKKAEKEPTQEPTQEQKNAVETDENAKQLQFAQPLTTVLIPTDFVTMQAENLQQNSDSVLSTTVDLNVENNEHNALSQTEFTDILVKPMLNKTGSENEVFTLQENGVENSSSLSKEQTVQTNELAQDFEMAKQPSKTMQDDIPINIGLSKNQEQEDNKAVDSLNQNEISQELKTENPKIANLDIADKQNTFDEVKTKTQDKAKDELLAQKVEGAKTQPNQQVDFAQAVDTANSVKSTESKEVIDQVLKHIESNFDFKTSEFSFNLYPKELGKVAVKMLVENGMLIVEFAATNAKTQSLLTANANQIRELLQTPLAQKQMQFVDASQNAQPHDYLKDENQNNQNANQNFSQNEQNQNAKDAEQQFTADFLSVMQMMKDTKVLESWRENGNKFI